MVSKIQNGDNIDWLCPVNWDCEYAAGLKAAYIAIQNQPGWKSRRIYDLTDPLYGNVGTLTNMDPATAWKSDAPPGGFGSLDFQTSASEYVTHPKPNVTASPCFSVVSWYWIPAVPTDFRDLWGIWDTGPSAKQQFCRYSSGVQWFVNNSADSAEASITISSSNLSLGDWNQIIFVADGTNLRGYVNGVEKPTPVALAGPYIPADTNNADWRIGGGRFATDGLQGKVSSLFYLMTGLSPSGAAAWYEDSLQGYPNLLRRIPSRTWFVPGGAPPATVPKGSLALLGVGI